MARNGSLTPAGYLPRLIEPRLDELMSAFGCVEIAGPKWCGKTWTALSRSESATRLDDPAEREVAQLDPNVALIGAAPHLVDEWQEVPQVWDAARRFVDDSGNRRGLLLLTGSSALSRSEREQVRHSGAGRIARVAMGPMALCESGEAPGGVSLGALLRGERLSPVRVETSLEQVARWCCRGGWPANLGSSDAIAAETAAQYLRAVIEVSVPNEGRSPDRAEALLRALALNVGQAATYRTLAQDAMRGGEAPDEDTVASYLGLFSRMHLIEELSGWEPPLRSKARVRVKPKRYFCDPSLPSALLGATPERLLSDAQTLGLLFETLVVRDLRTFLSTYAGLGNSLRYYRDASGLEADAIVECGGAWAAIEVKLSDMKADEGASTLLSLRRKLCENPAARIPDPAFLAVVVGRGSVAYQRPDGVLVIPIAALEP